ncbi:hypothetical protein EDC05_000099 [Coemansia umbellata]|uniref:Secreted protein n=1 Tax=Coemansia umbellata TaxID=1424467 RepID=A0ABQ8PV82_9FUNG|nr:hypothetical protein EDC05_000099 [Coemansia umbellata]
MWKEVKDNVNIKMQILEVVLVAVSNSTADLTNSQAILADEYETPKKFSACCTGKLETLKCVSSPRPFHRATMPTVRCYELLECFNESCLEFVTSDCAALSPRPRLWSCDLAVVMSFRHVLFGLWENDKIPECFLCGNITAQTVDGQQSAKRPHKGHKQDHQV